MRKLTKEDKKILLANQKTYLSKSGTKVQFWKLKTKVLIWKMNFLAVKYNLDFYAFDGAEKYCCVSYTKGDNTEAQFVFRFRHILWGNDSNLGIDKISEDINKFCEPTRRVAFAVKIPFIFWKTEEGIELGTYGDWQVLRRK